MEAKNWEHIENLFQEALPLGAVERVAYLDRVCSGDEALRAEVESLLAALEGQDDFMQEPAFNFGMKVLSSKTIESLVGKLIGPYKILNPLGKGGMGEVYVAEDMRLGRKVALKFLSASLVDDLSLVGKLIGPYKILNPLGKGGMGEVYVAEDMRLGRKVALKFLSASLVDD